MQDTLHYTVHPILVVLLICESAILYGIDSRVLGLSAFIGATISSFSLKPHIRRYFLMLLISLGILYLDPIKVNIYSSDTPYNVLRMICAVLLPWLVFVHHYHDKNLYVKDDSIHWNKFKFLYISIVTVTAYFVIPIYFKSAHQNLNWVVGNDWEHIALLFISLLVVGVWDELFFIATVLGILRNNLSFWKANIFQALIFASFLFSIGFGAWGFIPAFGFALAQGYIYSVTKSLAYAILVHLMFDLILFFALLCFANPTWPNLFIS